MKKIICLLLMVACFSIACIPIQSGYNYLPIQSRRDYPPTHSGYRTYRNYHNYDGYVGEGYYHNYHGHTVRYGR